MRKVTVELDANETDSIVNSIVMHEIYKDEKSVNTPYVYGKISCYEYAKYYHELCNKMIVAGMKANGFSAGEAIVMIVTRTKWKAFPDWDLELGGKDYNLNTDYYKNTPEFKTRKWG